MENKPTILTNLPRMASIDAFRGFVMLLMMGEVLSFEKVSKALPESGFWHFLSWYQSHQLAKGTERTLKNTPLKG